jgi:hypothetical protein
MDMAERGEDAELGGIADEDVEAAITVEQLSRKFVDLDEIAQVDRNERGRAADGPDDVVEFFETTYRARRQDDVRSLRGKAQGGGGPDAARGAGDQRDPAGQPPGYCRILQAGSARSDSCTATLPSSASTCGIG